MLNKAICKKCINNGDFSSWCDNERSNSWDWIDERIWKNEENIICHYGNRQSIKDAPPNKCPYILEHTILNQKEINGVIK